MRAAPTPFQTSKTHLVIKCLYFIPIFFPGCVCVCRRCLSFGPSWAGRRVIWNISSQSSLVLLDVGLIPAKLSNMTRRTGKLKQVNLLKKVSSKPTSHCNILDLYKGRLLEMWWELNSFMVAVDDFHLLHLLQYLCGGLILRLFC